MPAQASASQASDGPVSTANINDYIKSSPMVKSLQSKIDRLDDSVRKVRATQAEHGSKIDRISATQDRTRNQCPATQDLAVEFDVVYGK